MAAPDDARYHVIYAPEDDAARVDELASLLGLALLEVQGMQVMRLPQPVRVTSSAEEALAFAATMNAAGFRAFALAGDAVLTDRDWLRPARISADDEAFSVMEAGGEALRVPFSAVDAIFAGRIVGTRERTTIEAPDLTMTELDEPHTPTRRTTTQEYFENIVAVFCGEAAPPIVFSAHDVMELPAGLPRVATRQEALGSLYGLLRQRCPGAHVEEFRTLDPRWVPRLKFLREGSALQLLQLVYLMRRRRDVALAAVHRQQVAAAVPITALQTTGAAIPMVRERVTMRHPSVRRALWTTTGVLSASALLQVLAGGSYFPLLFMVMVAAAEYVALEVAPVEKTPRAEQPRSEEESGRCPRCTVQPVLVESSGELTALACPECRGHFLAHRETEQLLVEEQGFSWSFLRELATHFAGPSVRCPGCGLRMTSLKLRGAMVDLCLSCGGLWLDAGELARVSGDRYELPPS